LFAKLRLFSEITKTFASFWAETGQLQHQVSDVDLRLDANDCTSQISENKQLGI
jgi:hypothetical protein